MAYRIVIELTSDLNESKFDMVVSFYNRVLALITKTIGLGYVRKAELYNSETGTVYIVEQGFYFDSELEKFRNSRENKAAELASKIRNQIYNEPKDEDAIN
jgi:hypothetical protein